MGNDPWLIAFILHRERVSRIAMKKVAGDATVTEEAVDGTRRRFNDNVRPRLNRQLANPGGAAGTAANSPKGRIVCWSL